MSLDKGAQPGTPDLMGLFDNFALVAAKNRQIIRDFVAQQQSAGNIPEQDPKHIGEAFIELAQRMLADPPD